jgi:predicted Zn-dependent peptidase
MVWYKVGSADETPGKSGLAHFLEHLMFKGTVKPGWTFLAGGGRWAVRKMRSRPPLYRLSFSAYRAINSRR